jgi:organic radical activating enzyme
MKDFLDSIGPGFCLAKWTQATMHLGVGLTHSCHHTKAHHIDVNAIQKDPSALHNTQQKLDNRQAMLAGHRLPDCNYCWRVEDANAGVSDRVTKSSAPWSVVDKDAIVNQTWQGYPRSLEVSFSNACNFACAYCGPTFSSKWNAEISEQGPYQLSGTVYNRLAVQQIPNRDNNPYIDAFWKWFPNIIDGLHEFRITGGEPLMSKETFRILEMISNGLYKNLDFAINTNGCPPEQTWQNFCFRLKQIDDKNSCKSVTVYPSAETVGADAEYIRDGMDWQLFKSNIEYLLENTTQVKVSFMSTVSILSIRRMKEFLEWLNFLKITYGENRVRADLTQLKHPKFLDCTFFANKTSISLINQSITYLADLDHMTKERNRLLTIKSVMQNAKQDTLYKQLNEFILEYDQRRGLNGKELFKQLLE